MIATPADLYLQPGYFIDSDHPAVVAFAQQHTERATTPVARAVALYYAVRDGFRYNTYQVVLRPEALKASYLLTKAEGYCVEKACLLAATARAVGIPARLGFADVRNHLGSDKLLSRLRTDVFVYHGYTELYLQGAWRKATPAFNAQLCHKLGVPPLEFDGIHDAVFQSFEQGGQMEYLVDHGTRPDVPFDEFVAALKRAYPHLFNSHHHTTLQGMA